MSGLDEGRSPEGQVDVALADGARLATWTTGRAGRHTPVVAVHGGPGLWDYLGPWAQFLDGEVELHRYDQRGCGRSSGDGHAVERYVADLEELREHWGHERWTVIGHSFGAALALAYAAAHPERVAAVGHVSGVGIGDWRTPFRAEAARRREPFAQRFAELSARERTWDEEVEWRRIQWSVDHAADGWERSESMARTRLPINHEANRAITWTDADAIGWAAAATCPVFFVHGTADPRPAANAMLLAARIHRARKRVVEGAGHLPWVEAPVVMSELLGEIVRAGDAS